MADPELPYFEKMAGEEYTKITTAPENTLNNDAKIVRDDLYKLRDAVARQFAAEGKPVDEKAVDEKTRAIFTEHFKDLKGALGEIPKDLGPISDGATLPERLKKETRDIEASIAKPRQRANAEQNTLDELATIRTGLAMAGVVAGVRFDDAALGGLAAATIGNGKGNAQEGPTPP